MEFELSNLFLSLASVESLLKGVYQGELLADLILRSDVLIELPFRPVDEDIGLPRRVGGRDCRGVISGGLNLSIYCCC